MSLLSILCHYIGSNNTAYNDIESNPDYTAYKDINNVPNIIAYSGTISFLITLHNSYD